MSKRQIPIFSVAGLPVQGMVSSVDSASLGDGQFSLIQNLRWDTAALACRGGLAHFRVTTGLASGTVVGAFYDKDAGSYLAIKVGSSTRLYKFFAGAWSDINSANRLGDVSRVYFAAFTLPSPGPVVGSNTLNTAGTRSYLVVQDGVSAPQMVAVGVGTYAAVNVSTVSPPQGSMLKARPVTFANLPVPTTTTFTNSSASTTGTNVAYTVGTTTIGNCVQLNFTTTTAASHSIAFPFSASFTSEQPRQLQVVVNGRQDLFDLCTIEVGDASNWYVIHHPNVTRPQTASVADRFTSFLFDCSSVSTDVATSVTTSNWVSFPAITATRMRITYVNSAAPPAAFTAQIYAACFTQGVPFGTQFAVSFYNAETAVESPGIVIENQQPPALSAVSGTPIPGVRLASSPLAKYGYSIQWQSTGSNLDALIYARQGDTYYILDRNPTTTGANGTMGYDTINTLLFGRWIMPTQACAPIQTGTVMTVTGDRLFIAGVTGATASAKRNTVWFSEKTMPNRFVFASEVVRGQVQPRTGGIAVFGDETVTAVAPLSGQLYGGEGCIVWTEKGCYQLAGVDPIQLSRPSSIGPYGTVSPGSIARFRNSLCWVTPDRQMMQLGSDFGDLSARLIEDKIKAIPLSRMANIEATVFNERLYVAYTPATETVNKRILVFDSRTQGWSDDLIASNASCEFWVTSLVGNEARLLGVSPGGWTFEYDKPGVTGDNNVGVTTTVTTAPQIRLTTRTISASFFNQIRLGDVMVVADDLGSGVTWTAEYIERQGKPVANATVNMNGGGKLVWRFGRGSVENLRVGQIGLGVQLSIYGDSQPGKKIYAIAVEAEPQSETGADRE